MTVKLSDLQRQALEHAERARSEGVKLSQYLRAQGIELRPMYDALAAARRKGVAGAAMTKRQHAVVVCQRWQLRALSRLARNRTMGLRSTQVLIVALVASACASSPGAGDAEKTKVDDVAFCQLVVDGRVNDGRRVRVRATFGSGADYVRLFDQACPSSSIFAKSVRNDVDLTLCRSEELSEKFGCPVNGESGVRATFTGTYHYSTKTVGRLDVDGVSSISTER